MQSLGANRDATRETTTTKTLYRSNSPLIRNPDNMSELDSLLQDLSSSSSKVHHSYRGGSGGNYSSPMHRGHSPVTGTGESFMAIN